MAEQYKDSWLAKTFLVSTLNRVPVYFGFNWPIGALLAHDKPLSAAKGTENNPKRLKAEQESEKFRKWIAIFKTINRVAQGEYRDPKGRHGVRLRRSIIPVRRAFRKDGSRPRIDHSAQCRSCFADRHGTNRKSSGVWALRPQELRDSESDDR